MTPAPGWYPDPGGTRGRSATGTGRPGPPRRDPPPHRRRARHLRRLPAAATRRPRRRSRIGWVGRWRWWLRRSSLLARRDHPRPPRPLVATEPAVPTPSGGPVCPEAVQPSAIPPPQAGGPAWVSGRLSYPRLGAPFGRRSGTPRTPFGQDVQSQQATVEPTRRALRRGWRRSSSPGCWPATASTVRSRAPRWSPTASPRCSTATTVDRDDSRNEAITVDGHPAWIDRVAPDLRHSPASRPRARP